MTARTATSAFAGFAAFMSGIAGARADDATPRYSLQPRAVAVRMGDATSTVALPCDQTYGFVEEDGSLFVACGADGLVVFDVHDRARPTFYGRLDYGYACTRLTAHGDCVPPPKTHAPRRVRGPVNKRTRTVAATVLGLGAAAFAAGLIVELVQLGEDPCFLTFSVFAVGCAGNGPPQAVGWVGLGLIAAGATVALMSLPIWLASRPYVTATALVTPTGLGLRLTF